MLNAFLTGSYVYGEPRDIKDDNPSDIDLVVMCSKETIEKLGMLCDNSDDNSGHPEDMVGPDAFSLRFGMLNLICTTEEHLFEAWRKGTKILKYRKPVTRQEAIEELNVWRKKAYKQIRKENEAEQE